MFNRISNFLNEHPIIKAILIFIIVGVFGYACYMFLKDINKFKKNKKSGIKKLDSMTDDISVSSGELLINMNPIYIKIGDKKEVLDWNGIKLNQGTDKINPIVDEIQISGGMIDPKNPITVDVNEGIELFPGQSLYSRNSYKIDNTKDTMIFFKVKFNNQFSLSNQIISGYADINIPDYTWNIILNNYSFVNTNQDLENPPKVDLLRITIYQRNKQNYIRIVIGVNGNFVMKDLLITDIWNNGDYNTVGIKFTKGNMSLYINDKINYEFLTFTIENYLSFTEFIIGEYNSYEYINYTCERSWYTLWINLCKRLEFDKAEYNTNIKNYTVDLSSFYLLNTNTTDDKFKSFYKKFAQSNTISIVTQPVYTNVDLNMTDFDFKNFDINTETKRILGNSFFPFTSDIVCTNAIQNENRIYFTNIFYEQGFLSRWMSNNFDILKNKTVLDIQLIGTNNSLSYLLPDVTYDTIIQNKEFDDSFIKSLRDSLSLENLKKLNIKSDLLLFYLNILMIFSRMLDVNKSTFKKIPYYNPNKPDPQFNLLTNQFSIELNNFLNTIPDGNPTQNPLLVNPNNNRNKIRKFIYGILISWSQTQRVPIETQFSSGSRYFDLRLTKKDAVGNVYCTTGYFKWDSKNFLLESVLNNFKRILYKNPSEYIVLHFTDIDLEYFIRKIPQPNYEIAIKSYIDNILKIILNVFGDKLFSTYNIYRPLNELSSNGITLNKQVIILFNEIKDEWIQDYDWVFTKNNLNQTTGAQTTNIFSSYIQTKTQVENFDMNSLKLSILNSHCNIKDININTDENIRNEITSTIISGMINKNILTQPKNLIELSLQFTPSYVYSCLKEPYNNYAYPLRSDGNNNYNVIVVDNIQDFNVSKLLIDSTTDLLYDTQKQITNDDKNFSKALTNPNIIPDQIVEPLPIFKDNIVPNSEINGYIQIGNTLDNMYTDRISLINNFKNFNVEIPADCYLLSENKRFMFHIGSNLTKFSQSAQYINIFDLKEQTTIRYFSVLSNETINSLNIETTSSNVSIKINNSKPIGSSYPVKAETKNLIFYISNEGNINFYGETPYNTYEYRLNIADNNVKNTTFAQKDWDNFPDLLSNSTLIINYNNSYITSKAYIEGFNKTKDPTPIQLQNSIINIQPITIPNLIKEDYKPLNKGEEKFYLDIGNKLNDEILKYILNNSYTPTKIETFVNTYKYVLDNNINGETGRITPVIQILNQNINTYSTRPSTDLSTSINIIQNISWFASQPYEMTNYVEKYDEATRDEIINYLNINLRQFLKGKARVVGLLQCNNTTDFPNGYVGIVYDLGNPGFYSRTLVSFCGTRGGFMGTQLWKQILQLFGFDGFSTAYGFILSFYLFLKIGIEIYNAPTNTIMNLIQMYILNIIPNDRLLFDYIFKPYFTTLIFTSTTGTILKTTSSLFPGIAAGSAKFFQKNQRNIFAVIAFIFTIGSAYLYSQINTDTPVSTVQTTPGSTVKTTAPYYDEIIGSENDDTNLIKQFYDIYKNLPDTSKEIIITGHSLGGALGNVFISRLTKYFNDKGSTEKGVSLKDVDITSFLIAPSPSLTIESVKEFRKSYSYVQDNHFAIGNLFNNIQVFDINLSPAYQLGIENGYIKDIEKSIPFPLFQPVLDPVFLGSALYDKAAIISENRYGLVFENEKSKNIYNIHNIQSTNDMLFDCIVEGKINLQRINTEYNENVGKWNDTGKRVFYDIGSLVNNWLPENSSYGIKLLNYLTSRKNGLDEVNNYFNQV